MRHPYISITMAAVLVITSAGTVRAQEREEADSRPEFAISPAMARALSRPASPSDFKPIHPETLQQASSTARPGRRTARMVANGLAFGFIGMAFGHGIGVAADRNCGCHDPGEAGGFYGMMIGGAAGAIFGAWLGGR